MNTTEDTLDLVKQAQAKSNEDLVKYFTQTGTATQGFQAYNLEIPSKKLYPVMTPLRNMLPRISGGFGVQANWKAVTNINASNVRAGVGEGKRGGAIQHTLNEYNAAFKSIGLENYTTFEAENAARNFEDIRALAVQHTLESLMIQEERMLLAGNNSAVALGTTPTPSLALVAGGSLTVSTTYSVIAVGLGAQAYLDAVGSNNGTIGQVFNAATAAVPGQITRTNIDGTTDTFGGGSAQKSVAATIATTAGNLSIAATVAKVTGAVGYAWYIGAAGSEKLAAVTSINSVVITAPADAGAQAASTLAASDNSQCSVEYDGLLAQAWKSGSNAYVASLATGTAGTGSTLTSNGAGGISEFDAAFQYFFDVFRLSPTHIFVSSQESRNISKKIIANSGAPLLRQIENGASNIASGWKVTSVLNSTTGDDIPLVVHPNLPAGTVLFFTDRLPYPMSNVSNTAQVLLRQDYYQIDWPIQSRKRQYGVYADGVLQHYAPFSMGIITNIANG
ncbi:MAG: hypothetical protein WCH05_05480 [Chlorobiaceae bacterium]